MQSNSNNDVKKAKVTAAAQEEVRQKRAKLMASLMVYENPKNDVERQANFESSSRAVVGAVWVKDSGRWWVPPGLEHTHDLPFTYQPPFFGAEREYGPEEGWQTVRNTHSRSRSRRSRRRARQEEEVEVME